MLHFFLIFIIIGETYSTSKPHVILLLADDLGKMLPHPPGVSPGYVVLAPTPRWPRGWNDVGFHGSNQIPTPNIDALAYTGVILNNYYVNPICTPSRSALMTGKHPIHTGLQHGVILGATPYGLSLDEKILPQYFKDNGYTTRAVGKWHLGHFRKEYTPEFRGFDSHYGYWLGRQDYYDHSSLDKNMYWGYDMKRGFNTTWSEYGSYSTDLFTREAVKIIEEHNKTEPLLLYVAYQAVHSGNLYNSLEAPPEVIAKFAYIQDERRRKFAGMLSKLDDSVGEVVAALTKTGMLTHSIIIFSTDNGGPAAGFDDNAASNWPLRGVKSTLWQGGVKAVGLVWSPLLPSSTIFNGLMHITDWLPTIMHGIQGNASLDNIDGYDIWESIAGDRKKSPRTDVLLNIDPKQNFSGLIYNNWKLVKGHKKNGKWNGWYGPSGHDRPYNWAALWTCKAARCLQYVTPVPTKKIIEKLRNHASIGCNVTKSFQVEGEPTDEDIFLFNLAEDPCEMINQASKEPHQLEFMESLLSIYEKSMVEPRNQPPDPRSHPKYWGYQWLNWMDYV